MESSRLRLLLTIAIALLASELRAQTPDAETLKAAGIRTITSKHLTLYTDLPSTPGIDELPKVFDLAIPQWAEFFKADVERLSTWHVVACVMKDSNRFEEYRLMPRELPPFLHGLQRYDKVWVREQPNDYYRRHLLLHEGTHAVMNRIFGRVGPVWYREGIAEMLGTHSYRDGKLQLNIFPEDRKQVEYWGRIKIIRDDIRKNGTRQIDQIVDLPTRAFLSSDSYAWSWALQTLLHRRPEYLPICDALREEMHRSTRGVTRVFSREFQKQRAKFDLDWNLFIQHLDYGYDFSKEAIVFSPNAVELANDVVTVTVDAAKPWQATGLLVPADISVEFAAKGRYQVAVDSKANGAKPWMCEPQGVTIEYYQGRPLGQLLAAVVPQDASSTDSRFDPVAVGRRAKMTTKTGGQLFLRINERADRLGDNVGEITVRIRRSPVK